MLANSGHFNVELDLDALREIAESKGEIRTEVEQFVLKSGNSVFVIGEGRLVNLAAAEGHPAAVMDMSFANQALSAHYLYSKQAELKPGVYGVPKEIDDEIAALKLAAMHIEIDELTPEQQKYLASWQMGT